MSDEWGNPPLPKPPCMRLLPPSSPWIEEGFGGPCSCWLRCWAEKFKEKLAKSKTNGRNDVNV